MSDGGPSRKEVGGSFLHARAKGSDLWWSAPRDMAYAVWRIFKGAANDMGITPEIFQEFVRSFYERLGIEAPDEDLLFEYSELLQAYIIGVSNCKFDKDTIRAKIKEMGQPKYQRIQLMFADCMLRRLLADAAVWSAQVQPSHKDDPPIHHLDEFLEAVSLLVELSRPGGE